MAEVSNYDISDLQELILIELASSGPQKGWAIFRLIEKSNQSCQALKRIGKSSVYKSIDNLHRRKLIYMLLLHDDQTNLIYDSWNITDEGRQALRNKYNKSARMMDWRIKRFAEIWQ